MNFGCNWRKISRKSKCRKLPRVHANPREVFLMFSCTYEVVAIDGDYAHLKRNDTACEDHETKLVARALLPPEIMEGSILKYEMLQYELMS